MRRLNIPLVVGLLVSTVVLMISVHLLHAFQVDRNSKITLEQARAQKENGELERAFKLFDAYLKQNPDDADVYVEMAKLAVTMAELPGANPKEQRQAYDRLSSAADRNSEDRYVREKLAKYEVQLRGRAGLAKAIQHIEAILRNEPNDKQLLLLLAQYQIFTANHLVARETLLQLIGYDPVKKIFDPTKAQGPELIEAYQTLAESLQSTEPTDKKLANLVIQRMVEVNPLSSDAFLARIVWNEGLLAKRSDESNDRTFLLDQVHGDLEEAFKIAPQDIKVLSQKLKWCIIDQKFELGHVLVEQGLNEHKLDPAIYQLAADLATAEKNVELATAEKNAGAANAEKRKANLANAEKHSAEAIKHLKTGVEKLPKNFILRYTLVERLLEQGELTAAQEEANKLGPLAIGDKARWQRDFVDAQLEFFLEKNYQRAARILDLQSSELEAHKLPSPDYWIVEQLQRVYNLLARCYESTGQSDRMLEIWGRLDNLTPDVRRKNIVSQAGKARALAGLGRRDESLQILRDLRKGMQEEDFFAHRELWLPMLSSLVADQARLPKDKQNWNEVEKFFAEVGKHQCQGQTEHVIWRSDLYAQQGQLDKARETLGAELTLSETALAADPKNEDQQARNETLRMAAINLEAMQSHFPQALAAVDEALKQVGDKVNFRLRKAELLLRQGDQSTLGDGLLKLEANAKKYSVDEQVQLFLGLSVAHWHRGERGRDDARRLLKQVIELKPLDGRAYAILFRNSRDSKDPQALDEVTEAAEGLKRLLGTNAREWKLAEATRLMMEFNKDRDKHKENLVAVRQLLRDIEARSPRWYETDKIDAMVALAEGNTEHYFQKLEDALKHGPADTAVMRLLIPELIRTGRRADMQKLLDRVAGENQPLDLEKIDVESQLPEHRAETVEKAEKLIADLPPDAENYRWLANLLSRAGEHAKAEKAYRTAIGLAPKSPEPRLGLIQHLARFHDLDGALNEVHEMEKTLPPEGRASFLARGYQLLGEQRSAAEKFEEAIQNAPSDLNLNSEVVIFYRAANMIKEAEGMLEKTLAYQGAKRDNEDAYRLWARRQLVDIRAPRASYKDLQKTLALLDLNARNGQLPDDDIHLKARILSQRVDSESRRQAIDLFKDLDDRKKLNEVDRLLLATLYEQVGKWDLSQRIIATIVAKQPIALGTPSAKDDAVAQSQYADALSLYVTLLFEHNETDTAAGYLDTLSKLQPDAPRTISLRARLAAKQKNPAAAKAELERLIPTGPLQPEQEIRLLEVAASLRALRLYNEAGEKYQKFYDLHPQSILAYADFLGHHADLNAAFDLCEKAIPPKDNPAYVPDLMKVLQVAVSTLRARQALVTDKHYDRVQKWIDFALGENPGFAPLELKKAELLDLRGRNSEVEAIYRRLIKLPSKESDPAKGIDPFYRAIALNNLAYLLAIGEPPKGDEALAMINEVIGNFGPQRDFLDTRAMCYLAKGEVSKALVDLNDVLLDHNEKDLDDKSYAMKYCHMALALHRNQDDKAAQQSLNKAKALGLTPADFPILERPMVEQLQTEVAAKNAKPAKDAETKDPEVKDATKPGETRTSAP